MARRNLTEQTSKFLEITDPKKAVGLWSYRVVREMPMTPVGETDKALGRFLNGDIVRWEHRAKMAEALVGKGVGTKGGKSPARALEECLAEADADKNRLSVAEWREKYAWLLAWCRYSCRLTAPNVVAAEKDVQMFFNAPSAGVNCHEGNLHSGRVFFLRTKVAYFVAVVLKPGGTKWWSQIDHTNVTWTDNVYDRLIIDPRGKLEWSPILAEVINEQVAEKNICLFQLADDALFRAITDNELNPNEKYAHLCYAFDFFYRDKSKSEYPPSEASCAAGAMRGVEVEQRNLSSCASGLEKEANNHCTTSTSRFDFYLRWSAFLNPKKSKFTLVSKQNPRIVEVMGERKKGWISRQIEVAEVEGLEKVEGEVSVKKGNRSLKKLSRDEAARRQTSDAKLGLGDTPLDRYAQDVAHWVVENNGCAVLPAGASRELRLALSHALFFVTFPDRKPDEVGGILRGYQLPGRLVEHAAGKVRGDNSKAIKERSQKQSEEATARRRKMIVDSLFIRACTAVLMRNRNVLDEKGVVAKMDGIGARQIIEKAAWQRGSMEGNPLKLFKPGPTAGIGKFPDLSLALAFENRLGLKGETASATDLLVQTAPIRSLRESQGAIRETVAGAYPCRSMWTPSPGKEKGVVAYPSDSVRVLRDEGRYYLMAIPKYGLYKYERDLAFEPDVPGKKKTNSVPVRAYSFKSAGGVRSRADSSVVEEVFDINKVMRLARDGRLLLYSIDFGKDKWLADIVFTKDNKQPCKIVPTIPILAPEGTEKKDALEEGRKSGTDIVTKVSVTSETAQAFVSFTFNPTVARDNRKVEGRSWKSYLDAFPAEANRTIIRWPQNGEATSSSLVREELRGQLSEALQKVIETDGVLMTDKEHLDEALRAATYVVKDDPYSGYNLKDRIFKDTDGRAEWRGEKSKSGVGVEGGEDRKKKAELNAKYEAQRKEQKGKPLCEVLSPDLAREAEIEFTRQIEADTLVDAKTPKSFKLDAPIKVTDDFKEAVAREFRRIAYTGTMGWKQKLNRPAHEVALGIWLSRLRG